MKLKIKKLTPTAHIPVYATDGSACADVFADLPEADVTLKVGETALIPTGTAVEPDTTDVVLLLFARSGLASKHGIALANGVGVVDGDYRGEIKVALHNSGSADYTVRHGDRIAQLGVFPVLRAEIEETSDLSQTERGEGGFGHSGK